MDLYGTKIIDWQKKTKDGKSIRDFPYDVQKRMIIKAVMHFVKTIQSVPVEKKIVGAKLAGVDANLVGVAPVVQVMSDTVKSPDRGYELIFKEVDMRASTSKSFDMLDVSGGVTFYQHDEGKEAKLSSIPSSTKTPVSMVRYTGGFNILDDWLRFNEYYKIDELTEDTTRRWFDKRATIFYGLMEALSSAINEAFATDDVKTINNACANILINLTAAGYAVDENSQFVITCNPILRERIYKALAASFTNANTNNSKILYNIEAVVSTTKVANTSYYVSLPGGKNKRGEWEDLNLRPPQRNELVLGASHVWTGAYNGIIGEAKQHRRLALS